MPIHDSTELVRNIISLAINETEISIIAVLVIWLLIIYGYKNMVSESHMQAVSEKVFHIPTTLIAVELLG